MEQNSNTPKVLSGNELDYSEVKYLLPDEVFSEQAIRFLSTLSSELIRHPEARNYPDVTTFAFFCRKAHLYELKKRYINQENRIGRGVAFHIAPSNVPVNFAYSLVVGILSGNVNIVRVPSKDFPQVDIICDVVKTLLQTDTGSFFSNRIYLLQYNRESNLTATLSSICDIRIIWGGDATIAEIRKSPIPARAYDVTFADRYSFAAINAQSYLNEENKDKIASDFYNDTYLFDQNACTSPHLIVWLGDVKTINAAKELFWDKLYQLLDKKQYKTPDIVAVNKLTSMYLSSVNNRFIKKDSIDNKLWRMDYTLLPDDIDEYQCPGGYFSEYSAGALDEIRSIVNRRYQTMAYFGFEKPELLCFIKDNRFHGIDRITPIGKTTDFDLIWDGYDLVSSLSRIYTIT